MKLPDKKYQIIYADPPWQYEGEMMNGSVTDHYQWLSLRDICAIPVKELADDNCALFMWVALPKLNEFMDVINAWGFEYKSTAFVWIKTNKGGSYFMGQGRWTRANAEICVLATKGSPKRISAGVRQLVIGKVNEHSRKPNEVRNRIVELMGDLPRIELFARCDKSQTDLFGKNDYDDWDVWGNEANV